MPTTTVASWTLPDGPTFATTGDLTDKPNDRATLAVTASLGRDAYDTLNELVARLQTQRGRPVNSSAAVRFAVRLAVAALKASPNVAANFQDTATLSPESARLLAAVRTGRFRNRRELALHLGMPAARVSVLRQRMIDNGTIAAAEWAALARANKSLTTAQGITRQKRMFARHYAKASQPAQTVITLVSG